MIICEGHWHMVHRNAVRLWVTRGVFVRMRRAGWGEWCECCEHYQTAEIARRVA